MCLRCVPMPWTRTSGWVSTLPTNRLSFSQWACQMSDCFQSSNGKLTCISDCHNPHEDARRNDHAYYDRRSAMIATQNHQQNVVATNWPARTSCIGCHMPKVQPLAWVSHRSLDQLHSGSWCRTMNFGLVLVAGTLVCLLVSTSTPWITFTDIAAEAGLTAPTIIAASKTQKYIWKQPGPASLCSTTTAMIGPTFLVMALG